MCVSSRSKTSGARPPCIQPSTSISPGHSTGACLALPRVDLLAPFEARLGTDVPGPERPAVATALAELCRLGHAAWPDLAVRDADLCECAADRVRGPVRIADEIAALPAPDLALACACAPGDAAAIARFEDRYFRAARDAVRRMAHADAATADFLQRL